MTEQGLMEFDSLQIIKENGEFWLIYLWKSEEVYRQFAGTGKIDFDKGDTLTITGISGSMGITIKTG